MNSFKNKYEITCFTWKFKETQLFTSTMNTIMYIKRLNFPYKKYTIE